ncbi:Fe2+-dependent dioxygenase [Kordiimonas pumila]|uniref:Fe2+-dependent dioxygenase n=1 Tax=Kordiimonas pumila TaxID=2161677 RepID=A0ABV7D936_9PROT
MLICIPDILTSDEVLYCRKLLEFAQWIDGKVTAGAQSGQVKKNEQLPEESPEAKEAGNIILDALGRSPAFISAALPNKIFPPLFNRYAGGQYFGSHVDNSIRGVKGTAVRIRTDLSATLFLNDPATYEGGELVVESNYGAQEVKLDAGSLVLYPSTSLHHVQPVTSGTRLCSFFWLQSMVRDAGQREHLYDFDQSIQELSAKDGVDSPVAVKLSGLYHNLIRRWAEV